MMTDDDSLGRRGTQGRGRDRKAEAWREWQTRSESPIATEVCLIVSQYGDVHAGRQCRHCALAYVADLQPKLTDLRLRILVYRFVEQLALPRDTRLATLG